MVYMSKRARVLYNALLWEEEQGENKGPPPHCLLSNEAFAACSPVMPSPFLPSRPQTPAQAKHRPCSFTSTTLSVLENWGRSLAVV